MQCDMKVFIRIDLNEDWSLALSPSDSPSDLLAVWLAGMYNNMASRWLTDERRMPGVQF